MKLKNLLIIIAIFSLTSITAFYLYSQNTQKSPDYTECLESENNLACLAKIFHRTIKNEGLSESFDLLSDLYANEEITGAQCHDLTHIIGESAYWLMQQDKKIAITNKAAYCGFGFFHGLMETLVPNSPDKVADIRQFCNQIQSDLANDNRQIKMQCYHGVGHGAVLTHEDITSNKMSEIVAQGVVLCEKAAKDIDEKYLLECLYGVYGGIADGHLNPIISEKMTPSSDQQAVDFEKSIGICSSERVDYQPLCYETMTSFFPGMYNCDISSALNNLSSRPPSSHLAIIKGIGSAFSFNCQNLREDPKTIIDSCQKLDSSQKQTNCITGFVGGILSTGLPGSEHIEAQSFCTHTLMSIDNKISCENVVISYIVDSYHPSKRPQMCGIFQAEAKNTCLKGRE